MFRANRRAFISGEVSIRWRIVRRSSASRSGDCASVIAVCTYCLGRRAASSGSPMFDRMLFPPRPTAVWPTRLTTGTPIQNESRLVVWPL